MSIRPIDFQVLMPKTQQQSQENQIANNRASVDQENLMQQNKINTEHQLKKVNQSESKDHPNIRDEQSSKQKGNKRHLEKRKKQDEKGKDKKNSEKKAMNGIGINLDIKI
ncbi:MAG: hypothetical protein N4A64_11720 [Marinisporobacter sp.]|nr:hypothetical protein [Marinisporobacter sp.]